MDIIQMLITPNKYSRPQTPLKQIKKVVVHYVGNPKSTAKNNRDYFNNLQYGLKDARGNYLYVSAHYVVGLEGEIICCVPENEIAYCSNSANAYSISIETCHPDTTGRFNGITEKSLILLVADICKRHGLNPDKDVIRHYDVTGKACPLWYVSHEEDWEAFKKAVSEIVTGKPKPPVPTDEAYYIWVGKFSDKSRAENYIKLISQLDGSPYCELRRV